MGKCGILQCRNISCAIRVININNTFSWSIQSEIATVNHQLSIMFIARCIVNSCSMACVVFVVCKLTIVNGHISWNFWQCNSFTAEWWNEQFWIAILDVLYNSIPGLLTEPHLSQLTPSIVTLLQDTNFIDPILLQFTVGLPCPIIVILLTLLKRTFEDNTISVDMSIIMLQETLLGTSANE